MNFLFLARHILLYYIILIHMFDFEELEPDNTEIEDLKDIISKIDYSLPNNRHLVYLQLLKKRLKKFEYIEKNNISIVDGFISSSDNSYLSEKDYSEIINPNAYHVTNKLTKNETLEIIKYLEEKIIMNDIYNKNNKIKIIDEYYEDFNLNLPLKIRYLGFSDIKYIEEYYVSFYGIGIIINQMFFFEVLDNLETKYICYSNHSSKMYKLVNLPKIEYYPNTNCELYIIRKDISNYGNLVGFIYYTFSGQQENIYNYVYENKFFKYIPFNNIKTYIDNHIKANYTKGINL